MVVLFENDDGAGEFSTLAVGLVTDVVPHAFLHIRRPPPAAAACKSAARCSLLPLQIARPLPVSLPCQSVTYPRLKPFCISVTCALAPPLQIHRPRKTSAPHPSRLTKSVVHATAWYYARHTCVWRKTSTAGTRSRKQPTPRTRLVAVDVALSVGTGGGDDDRWYSDERYWAVGDRLGAGRSCSGTNEEQDG